MPNTLIAVWMWFTSIQNCEYSIVAMTNTQEKNLKLWVPIFLSIFHGTPEVGGPGTDFLAFP